MSEPTQRGVEETEPSGAPGVKKEAGSSGSLRGRLGDGWIIAAMAVASIVSIGAILGWALFTGNNKSDNVGSGGSSAAPINKTLDVTLGEFFVKPAKIDLPKGKHADAERQERRCGSSRPEGRVAGHADVEPRQVVGPQGRCGRCFRPGLLHGPRPQGRGDDVRRCRRLRGYRRGRRGFRWSPDDRHGRWGHRPERRQDRPDGQAGQGLQVHDPVLKPAPAGTVHNVTFEARDKLIEVAPGVKQLLWTFNDTVPGPTLRGKVGDTFNVKLVNKGTIGHSIDFHASQTSMDVDMRTLQPGESLTYTFVARPLGHLDVPLRHGTDPCTTSPTACSAPWSSTRPTWPKVDQEYLLVQSEYYLGLANKESRPRQGDGRHTRRGGLQRLLQPVRLRPDQGEGRRAHPGVGARRGTERDLGVPHRGHAVRHGLPGGDLPAAQGQPGAGRVTGDGPDARPGRVRGVQHPEEGHLRDGEPQVQRRLTWRGGPHGRRRTAAPASAGSTSGLRPLLRLPTRRTRGRSRVRVPRSVVVASGERISAGRRRARGSGAWRWRSACPGRPSRSSGG